MDPFVHPDTLVMEVDERELLQRYAAENPSFAAFADTNAPVLQNGRVGYPRAPLVEERLHEASLEKLISRANELAADRRGLLTKDSRIQVLPEGVTVSSEENVPTIQELRAQRNAIVTKSDVKLGGGHPSQCTTGEDVASVGAAKFESMGEAMLKENALSAMPCDVPANLCILEEHFNERAQELTNMRSMLARRWLLHCCPCGGTTSSTASLGVVSPAAAPIGAQSMYAATQKRLSEELAYVQAAHRRLLDHRLQRQRDADDLITALEDRRMSRKPTSGEAGVPSEWRTVSQSDVLVYLNNTIFQQRVHRQFNRFATRAKLLPQYKRFELLDSLVRRLCDVEGPEGLPAPGTIATSMHASSRRPDPTTSGHHYNADHSVPETDVLPLMAEDPSHVHAQLDGLCSAFKLAGYDRDETLHEFQYTLGKRFSSLFTAQVECTPERIPHLATASATASQNASDKVFLRSSASWCKVLFDAPTSDTAPFVANSPPHWLIQQETLMDAYLAAHSVTGAEAASQDAGGSQQAGASNNGGDAHQAQRALPSGMDPLLAAEFAALYEIDMSASLDHCRAKAESHYYRTTYQPQVDDPSGEGAAGDMEADAMITEADGPLRQRLQALYQLRLVRTRQLRLRLLRTLNYFASTLRRIAADVAQQKVLSSTNGSVGGDAAGLSHSLYADIINGPAVGAFAAANTPSLVDSDSHTAALLSSLGLELGSDALAILKADATIGASSTNSANADGSVVDHHHHPTAGRSSALSLFNPTDKNDPSQLPSSRGQEDENFLLYVAAPDRYDTIAATSAASAGPQCSNVRDGRHNGVLVLDEWAVEELDRIEHRLLRTGSFYLARHQFRRAYDGADSDVTNHRMGNGGGHHDDDTPVSPDEVCVLEDLFESEVGYQESKISLLDSLREAYEHSTTQKSRSALVQQTMQLLFAAPRINLSDTYFVPSYTSAVIAHDLESALLRDVIAHQIASERRNADICRAAADSAISPKQLGDTCQATFGLPTNTTTNTASSSSKAQHHGTGSDVKSTFFFHPLIPRTSVVHVLECYPSVSECVAEVRSIVADSIESVLSSFPGLRYHTVVPGDAVLGSVVESPNAVSCITKEVLQELIVQWRLLGHDEAVSREMRLNTNAAHAGSNDGDDGSDSDNDADTTTKKATAAAATTTTAGGSSAVVELDSDGFGGLFNVSHIGRAIDQVIISSNRGGGGATASLAQPTVEKILHHVPIDNNSKGASRLDPTVTGSGALSEDFSSSAAAAVICAEQRPLLLESYMCDQSVRLWLSAAEAVRLQAGLFAAHYETEIWAGIHRSQGRLAGVSVKSIEAAPVDFTSHTAINATDDVSHGPVSTSGGPPAGTIEEYVTSLVIAGQASTATSPGSAAAIAPSSTFSWAPHTTASFEESTGYKSDILHQLAVCEFERVLGVFDLRTTRGVKALLASEQCSPSTTIMAAGSDRPTLPGSLQALRRAFNVQITTRNLFKTAVLFNSVSMDSYIEGLYFRAIYTLLRQEAVSAALHLVAVSEQHHRHANKRQLATSGMSEALSTVPSHYEAVQILQSRFLTRRRNMPTLWRLLFAPDGVRAGSDSGNQQQHHEGSVSTTSHTTTHHTTTNNNPTAATNATTSPTGDYMLLSKQQLQKLFLSVNQIKASHRKAILLDMSGQAATLLGAGRGATTNNSNSGLLSPVATDGVAVKNVRQELQKLKESFVDSYCVDIATSTYQYSTKYHAATMSRSLRSMFLGDEQADVEPPTGTSSWDGGLLSEGGDGNTNNTIPIIAVDLIGGSCGVWAGAVAVFRAVIRQHKAGIRDDGGYRSRMATSGYGSNSADSSARFYFFRFGGVRDPLPDSPASNASGLLTTSAAIRDLRSIPHPIQILLMDFSTPTAHTNLPAKIEHKHTVGGHFSHLRQNAVMDRVALLLHSWLGITTLIRAATTSAAAGNHSGYGDAAESGGGFDGSPPSFRGVWLSELAKVASEVETHVKVPSALYAVSSWLSGRHNATFLTLCSSLRTTAKSTNSAAVRLQCLGTFAQLVNHSNSNPCVLRTNTSPFSACGSFPGSSWALDAACRLRSSLFYLLQGHVLLQVASHHQTNTPTTGSTKEDATEGLSRAGGGYSTSQESPVMPTTTSRPNLSILYLHAHIQITQSGPAPTYRVAEAETSKHIPNPLAFLEDHRLDTTALNRLVEHRDYNHRQLSHDLGRFNPSSRIGDGSVAARVGGMRQLLLSTWADAQLFPSLVTWSRGTSTGSAAPSQPTNLRGCDAVWRGLYGPVCDKAQTTTTHASTWGLGAPVGGGGVSLGDLYPTLFVLPAPTQNTPRQDCVTPFLGGLTAPEQLHFFAQYARQVEVQENCSEDAAEMAQLLFSYEEENGPAFALPTSHPSNDTPVNGSDNIRPNAFLTQQPGDANSGGGGRGSGSVVSEQFGAHARRLLLDPYYATAVLIRRDSLKELYLALLRRLRQSLENTSAISGDASASPASILVDQSDAATRFRPGSTIPTPPSIVLPSTTSSAAVLEEHYQRVIVQRSKLMLERQASAARTSVSNDSDQPSAGGSQRLAAALVLSRGVPASSGAARGGGVTRTGHDQDLAAVQSGLIITEINKLILRRSHHFLEMRIVKLEADNERQVSTTVANNTIDATKTAIFSDFCSVLVSRAHLSREVQPGTGGKVQRTVFHIPETSLHKAMEAVGGRLREWEQGQLMQVGSTASDIIKGLTSELAITHAQKSSLEAKLTLAERSTQRRVQSVLSIVKFDLLRTNALLWHRNRQLRSKLDGSRAAAKEEVRSQFEDQLSDLQSRLRLAESQFSTYRSKLLKDMQTSLEEVKRASMFSISHMTQAPVHVKRQALKIAMSEDELNTLRDHNIELRQAVVKMKLWYELKLARQKALHEHQLWEVKSMVEGKQKDYWADRGLTESEKSVLEKNVSTAQLSLSRAEVEVETLRKELQQQLSGKRDLVAWKVQGRKQIESMQAKLRTYERISARYDIEKLVEDYERNGGGNNTNTTAAGGASSSMVMTPQPQLNGRQQHGTSPAPPIRSHHNNSMSTPPPRQMSAPSATPESKILRGSALRGATSRIGMAIGSAASMSGGGNDNARVLGAQPQLVPLKDYVALQNKLNNERKMKETAFKKLEEYRGGGSGAVGGGGDGTEAALWQRKYHDVALELQRLQQSTNSL